MDSQYSTAAIDELMSVVRQVQKKTQRNTGNPVFVTIHFVLAGLAVVAFAAVVLCRLVGYQIGDELTDKYVFSLVTSVLFFAVGTLMIERLSGDVFGGFLGRALALCGLFVMSTQCYEFMQKTRACEVQHELLARQKANPVSNTATLVSLHRQVVVDGITIDWESDEPAKSTGSGSVSGVCAKMGSGKTGVAGSGRVDRGSDAVRGRAGNATGSGLPF